MNLDKPIEIAENVFWVGAVIPEDQFQCHVYLIRNGDESILIDPGSRITYDITKKKIEQIVKLKDIKYLICHHQDPDIIGCMDQLIKDTGKSEKYVVTHWRTWALLKHCDWDVKLYEVEEKGWKLKAGDRLLKFIFTPYMHFPGAFCSYDVATKSLFSSDIFGGFTPTFELFAKSAEDYFEKLKPFHEHYIPSNAILVNGLSKIEKYDIEIIAPQHGSIIKRDDIKPLIEKMKNLKCGLFEKFTNTRDVLKLSKLNDLLEEIIKIIAYQERFYKVIDKFMCSLKQFYNIDSIKAFVISSDETSILELDSEKTSIIFMKDYNKLRQMVEASSYIKNGALFFKPSKLHTMFGIEEPSYTFPVKDRNERFYGICFIVFNPDDFNIYVDLEILSKFEIPISMAILAERKEYCTNNRIIQLHEEAVKDPLTGLFNRRYMNLLAEMEFKKTKRYSHPLSVLMIDIDHFKSINDKYGHKVGDLVLKHVAQEIRNHIRSSDIPIRYGGEEFVIVLPNTTRERAYTLAERIRKHIDATPILVDGNEINCKVSIGISSMEDNPETFGELVNNSDKRMYLAKQSGRNRTVF